MNANCLEILKHLSSLIKPGRRVRVICKTGGRPGTYLGIIVPDDTENSSVKLGLGSIVEEIRCEDINGIEAAADDVRTDGFYPFSARPARTFAAASALS